MSKYVVAAAIAAIMAASHQGPAFAEGASASAPRLASTGSGHSAAKPADQEVIEAALRYLDACVTRDAAYVAANSIDDPAGSYSGITTGPGPAQGLQEIVDHLKGLKPVKWSGQHPKGYVVGDFAWFTDYAKGIIPSGQALDIRATLLMRRVGKDWKVVHFHVSEGVQRGGIKLDQ
jgi:hypothetical protein